MTYTDSISDRHPNIYSIKKRLTHAFETASFFDFYYLLVRNSYSSNHQGMKLTDVK